MDMDESSLVLMEMDTICREDSLSDVAPRYLFHIRLRRKIKPTPIDIYREVRVVMRHIGSWCEYIGSKYTDNQEKNVENIFFQL
jgi:hypothetical protein